MYAEYCAFFVFNLLIFCDFHSLALVVNDQRSLYIDLNASVHGVFFMSVFL